MKQDTFVRLARQYIYSNPDLTLGQLDYRLREYAKYSRDADALVGAVHDSKMFVMSDDGHVRLTEDEQTQAVQHDLRSVTWYSKFTPCGGCVRVSCVCEASLMCMNQDTGHKVGCHGSHD